MRLLTVPGVFRPRSDSRLLADVVADRVRPGASVLDPFTGSGILAIAAACAGAGAVTAVDVSGRAVACARLNARLNGVRLRALRGDSFAPVVGERFDLIVANPPYLPGAQNGAARGAARAWEGGADGRRLLDRVCREAPRHLEPGGELLLVQSSVCGVDATIELLAGEGMAVEVVAARRGPFGPLLAARAPELERRGAIAPGQRTEDVVVLAARPGVHSNGNGSPGRRSRAPARVTPYRDGPYLVRGDFELVDQDGDVIAARRGTVALCRCGGSRTKPFCDGTHKTIGFEAPSAAVEQPLR
jgi:release factor glutamine methyltransferase